MAPPPKPAYLLSRPVFLNSLYVKTYFNIDDNCRARLQTVQHIDMPFAPYDRAMLDARSLCGS